MRPKRATAQPRLEHLLLGSSLLLTGVGAVLTAPYALLVLLWMGLDDPIRTAGLAGGALVLIGGPVAGAMLLAKGRPLAAQAACTPALLLWVGFFLVMTIGG